MASNTIMADDGGTTKKKTTTVNKPTTPTTKKTTQPAPKTPIATAVKTTGNVSSTHRGSSGTSHGGVSNTMLVTQQAGPAIPGLSNNASYLNSASGKNTTPTSSKPISTAVKTISKPISTAVKTIGNAVADKMVNLYSNIGQGPFIPGISDNASALQSSSGNVTTNKTGFPAVTSSGLPGYYDSFGGVTPATSNLALTKIVNDNVVPTHAGLLVSNDGYGEIPVASAGPKGSASQYQPGSNLSTVKPQLIS